MKTLIRDIRMAIALPYVRRELPAWGRVYDALIGDWRRDDRWKDAGPRSMVDKVTGYRATMDISRWADRLNYALGRWYDSETLAVLRAYATSGGTIVDVGANQGRFAFAAAHIVGPSGRVIAFEPNPVVLAALRAEASANDIDNIETHQMGLSNEDDVLELYVPDINSGSGAFIRDDAAPGVAVQAAVRRGDDILADAQPSLIKIDVEGFEGYALDGMRATLRRARPIVLTEVLEQNFTRFGLNREHHFRIMEQEQFVGFRPRLRRDGGFTLDADLSGDDFNVVWIPREDPRMPATRS